MDLQVLVATMQQTDLSLAERMNLRQNAVIANQCGQWKYEERISEAGQICMLSTDTKGVGVNRNLAMQLASADILLFADDDIVYYDSDLQEVADAFRQLPDADVIFFAIDMTRDGQVFDKRRHKTKRLHLWNSLRYGACRMAVRRGSILKKGLSFSTLFGGGCIYCSGEDTIFIREAFRAGLRVYSYDYVLGACAKDSSTWFSGFDEKYFFDRGAMIACAFPRLKRLMGLYFALKLSKKSAVTPKTILRLMHAGMAAFGKLQSFDEWKQTTQKGDVS